MSVFQFTALKWLALRLGYVINQQWLAACMGGHNGPTG